MSFPCESSYGYVPSDASQSILEASAIMEMDDNVGMERTCLNFSTCQTRNTNGNSTFFTSGCEQIDVRLGGGIPLKQITELWGVSGTGMTQFCLQLAITAQLMKSANRLDNSGVYYIYTSGDIPTKRLAELVTYFRSKHPYQLPEDPMNNIFVDKAFDQDDLIRCVRDKLPFLLTQKTIRLVVIDSIGGIYRGLFRNDNGLHEIARLLQEYSTSYNLAVVVSNQASYSPTLQRNVPCLGRDWTQYISTRIQMRKQPSQMEIEFSPYVQPSTFPFILCAEGIKGAAYF